MKFSNEIWAVIPARCGSKSLKNKNIKNFLGKPLLAHSIISAKKNIGESLGEEELKSPGNICFFLFRTCES